MRTKTATMAAIATLFFTGCGNSISGPELLADQYRQTATAERWNDLCETLHPDIRQIAGNLHAAHRLRVGDKMGAKVVHLSNQRHPGSECAVGMTAMADTLDLNMPPTIRTETREDAILVFTEKGTWAWSPDGHLVDAPWFPDLIKVTAGL